MGKAEFAEKNGEGLRFVQAGWSMAAQCGRFCCGDRAAVTEMRQRGCGESVAAGFFGEGERFAGRGGEAEEAEEGPQENDEPADDVEESERGESATDKNTDFPIGDDGHPERLRSGSGEEGLGAFFDGLNAGGGDGDVDGMVVRAGEDEEGFAFDGGVFTAVSAAFFGGALAGTPDAVGNGGEGMNRRGFVGDDEKEALFRRGGDGGVALLQGDVGDWGDSGDEGGREDEEDEAEEEGPQGGFRRIVVAGEVVHECLPKMRQRGFGEYGVRFGNDYV